jgi:hypothetical protein
VPARDHEEGLMPACTYCRGPLGRGLGGARWRPAAVSYAEVRRWRAFLAVGFAALSAAPPAR